MKRSILNILVLAAAALAGAQAADAGEGGGSIGSGGDGLIFVPPGGAWPFEPGDGGFLTVSADPSPGQPQARLYASRCEPRTGLPGPKFGSCVRKPIVFGLNETVWLPVGSYLLSLAPLAGRDGFAPALLSARELVTIGKNDKSNLTLSRIRLPRTGIAASQRVFVDLSDREMQERSVYEYFGQGAVEEDRHLSRRAQKACPGHPINLKLADAALGSFEATLDLVEYRPDGSAGWATGFDSGCNVVRKRARQFVNAPQDGGFVLVFPGAYGIETMDENGGFSYQQGIHVR